MADYGYLLNRAREVAGSDPSVSGVDPILNFMLPETMSLIRGEPARKIPNVPETGKVPMSEDPRTGGSMLEIGTTLFPTPTGATGKLLLGMAGAARFGGRGGGKALRDLPLKKGLAAAASDEHLIPKEGGGYVGAPDWIKTPEDLAKMRAEYDRRADAGLQGLGWYKRAQKDIKEMAGPDKAKQHLTARELGLTSWMRNPDTNLGLAIAAHNAFEAGRPLTPEASSPVTGVQAGRHAELRAAKDPADVYLGSKADPYSDTIDPTRRNMWANDRWHGRATGFSEKEIESMTDARHRFMDGETLAATARARARQMGGKANWMPSDLQELPWMTGKAEDLMRKRKLSEQEAWAEAKKTYGPYFDKYTAFGTYEATPGPGIGHLPDLPTADYAERAAFAADPRSSWRDPTSMRDIIYDALGMWQRPTQEITGLFHGQTNPAQAARPLVSLTPEKEVAPISRSMLNTAEGLRAYLDAQIAGAWHMPIGTAEPKQSTSLRFPLQDKMTPEQIIDMSKRMEAWGLGDVVDTGQGATVTNFYPGPPPAEELAKRMRAAGPQGPAADILPGIEPQRVKVEGSLAPPVEGAEGYSKAWMEPQGSGAVTRELQNLLNDPNVPNALKRLDTQEIRNAALARLERDAEYASRTGQPVREDVQLARKIISQSGLPGLFDALAKGAPLPAIAPFLLQDALNERQ